MWIYARVGLEHGGKRLQLLWLFLKIGWLGLGVGVLFIFTRLCPIALLPHLLAQGTPTPCWAVTSFWKVNMNH